MSDRSPSNKSAKVPSEDRKGARDGQRQPCPHPCDMIPLSVPGAGRTNPVLHPRKDVFVLKVAKVGANGDRRCKVELELVTPKGPEKKQLCRIDTRETQCDPDPPPCCCCGGPKSHKKKN